MSAYPELLIAHKEGVGPTTHIRSTILQSSVASLREFGHFQRWYDLVDAQFRAQIVESIAPSWLPLEVAHAHYRACDKLALSQMEQTTMGSAVGDRIQGSFLATLMKSVRAAGVNPWVLLQQFDRLWSRIFQGGTLQLTRTAPKDCEIEIRGNSLCDYSYFRTAFTGVIRAGVLLAGVRSAVVRQGRFRQNPSIFVMSASWV